jgi:hypothetical protein
MVQTYPHTSRIQVKGLTECIEACFDCVQSCTACVDACLGEGDVQILARCIRLNLDCADVCGTTGRMLSRQTEADVAVLRGQLQACALACRTCGAECERHAAHGMRHCAICAEVCYFCETACNQLLEVLAA